MNKCNDGEIVCPGCDGEESKSVCAGCNGSGIRTCGKCNGDGCEPLKKLTKKAERELLFNKYGGKCAYCGEDLPEKGWHADHIIAIRRNKRKWESGMQKPHLDIIENKNPSCASCNINKHKMTIEEFRHQIENFINSMNKRMTQYKLAKRYGLVEETGIDVEFYFEKYERENG